MLNPASARRAGAAPGGGLFGLTLGFLCVAMVFGGGTHGDAMSSAVVRLASLPLLAASVWRIARTPGARPGWAAVGLLCAIILAPVMQLVPVPPHLWTQMPGRGFLAADYGALGLPLPWLATSLAPYETGDALLGLLPPAAMFLAATNLEAPERRRMMLAIPWLTLLTVVLGMIQTAGGPASGLRFYADTNRDSGVGFFANRNHQAALLVISVALAPLWISVSRGAVRGIDRFAVFLAIAIELVLFVGIGVTRSRAGVFLAAPAIALGALIMAARGGASHRRPALALLGAAVVGSGLVAAFASTTLIARFQAPLAADQRVVAGPAIRRAAETFFPWGSGLGSFERIYRMFEPIGSVRTVYLNHAHNDLMEIWLEAGLAGLVLVGAFILWWLSTTARAWMRSDKSAGAGIQVLASLVIGLLLAHSLVDYPLRTAALTVIFALACGILAAPPATARLSNAARTLSSTRPGGALVLASRARSL